MAKWLLAVSVMTVASQWLSASAALAQGPTDPVESLARNRVTLATFAFVLGLILVAMVLAFLYQDRKQTTQVFQGHGLVDLMRVIQAV